MSFENVSVDKLIDTYNKAKEAYYNTGQPIMSDSEFDKLEDYLISNNYIDKHVGTEEVKGKKTPHISPMLSLGKVQVFSESFEIEHFEEIQKKLSRYSQNVSEVGGTMIRGMHKLDGLAMNIMYYEGKLKTIATRGNGSIGTDVTAKLKHLVPNTLSVPFSGEIRGEIFVSKTAFLEKYAEDYKNPRNLASGIINSSDDRDPRIKDLSLFVFELKGNLKTLGEIPDLHNIVIESILFMNSYNEAKEAYEQMQLQRASLPYPTDGIVMRIATATEHRDNGHEPLYAIAVKFPPMIALTKIIDIVWEMGKTGNYYPTAVLEPTELDGTIVVHAGLHNYAWIEEKGAYIGSTVRIGKNGDIIPQIQEVVEIDPNKYMNLPSDTKVSENGKHLQSTLDVSEQIARIKFNEGLKTLKLFGQGDATYSKLFDLFEGKAENIFRNDLFTKEKLFPIFGKGTSGVKFIKERNSRLKNGLSVAELLRMIQFDNAGDRHTNRLAPHYESIITGNAVMIDLSGLNRAVVEDITQNEASQRRVIDAINLYKENGFEWVFPKVRVIQETDITFEMTGSPKDAGYKTKEDFVKFVSTWVHTKLGKTTTYLITDDLESKTSKMKTAEKHGVKVLSYEQATDLFKESLN